MIESIKVRTHMKVSSRKVGQICISFDYAIRTKKDHLNIVMNDWEQRLITMNNQDAENYDAKKVTRSVSDETKTLFRQGT